MHLGLSIEKLNVMKLSIAASILVPITTKTGGKFGFTEIIDANVHSLLVHKQNLIMLF